jgi:hypothetical protein
MALDFAAVALDFAAMALDFTAVALDFAGIISNQYILNNGFFLKYGA